MCYNGIGRFKQNGIFEFIEKQLPKSFEEKKIMWAVSGEPIIVKEGKNVTGEFKTTRNNLDLPAARTVMGYTEDNVLLIITSRRAAESTHKFKRCKSLFF